MEQFWTEYALFLAQTATILGALVAAIFAFVALSGHKEPAERLEINKLNDKFDDFADALRHAVLDRKARRRAQKAAKKRRRQAQERAGQPPRKRIFVLDFDGDLKASAAEALAQEITAVLTIASGEDEVFVRLYSAGGLVHGYGFAASQLERLRQKQIPLTVAVDKLAASGGYMMACVANQIIASPFAIVGSIGVVAGVPNFHRFLQKHDVDFELHTAGQFKRTLTLFGENTDAAREKFRQEITDTHALFKEHIVTHRPQVDIEQVGTGEHWHARRALDLKLVDALQTSDDYLLAKSSDYDIFEVRYTRKRGLAERFANLVKQTLAKLDSAISTRSREQLLP